MQCRRTVILWRFRVTIVAAGKTLHSMCVCWATCRCQLYKNIVFFVLFLGFCTGVRSEFTDNVSETVVGAIFTRHELFLSFNS